MTLALEVVRAWTFPFVYSTEPISEWDEQENRLEFLAYELERLFQNPELFPSIEVLARFAALMGTDAELQLSKATKDLLIVNEIQNLAEASEVEWTRTSYRAGTKPWENFLFNDGIGVVFTPEQTHPRSVFQVVPPAGMRIIGNASRHERAIVRWLRDV